MAGIALEGIIIDINYVTAEGRSVIRITLRQGSEIHTLYDYSFYPYFYLLPSNKKLDESAVAGIRILDNNDVIEVHGVSRRTMSLAGRDETVFRIEVYNSRHVPKLSDKMREFGAVYEYDIVFWKRYLIDKGISPLAGVQVQAHDQDGKLVVDEIKPAKVSGGEPSYICFDIETYNPLGVPRPEVDPVIMISYVTSGGEHKVLTTKKIDRDFVVQLKDERELIQAFIDVVKKTDADVIAGYNSSNFDLPYLQKRAQKNRVPFDITRYGEEPKGEHHGLIEAFRIPGRTNADIYNVTKFVSVVGASEKLLKINRFTLSEVYRSITGDTKIMVEKPNIWQIWDRGGRELEEFADYSLSDSIALSKLYEFFMPLEIEIAKISGSSLGEATISTAGQLVEYFLMRYACSNNELIPDKPEENEIGLRLANPIEGAYVKTPEAGIYDRIVVFDFRGLYPSIIIAHNIDPSALCKGCDDYYEAPDGTRFRKSPAGIIPQALKVLIAERAEVKKAYKKDPDNQTLAARSSALKILANSFYGYLGYARSRWYSRDCAAAVTAFGRAYLTKTMTEAEAAGFRVIYGDTDSQFLQMGSKTKDDALALLKKVNGTLPQSMELELEDFYTRGVFVGKRGGEGAGAKKKYALLSESGRIKIRGFELVRRDWSFIAKDTQKRVLEAILKDGSKEKAVAIVKDVVARLKEGKVPLKELTIYTQLRKRIESYDATSPELAAARKAIATGFRRRDQVEGATIGYVITRHGDSISEKAELEDMARDYDPDYYINHQILPSTLKILKELGFSENELKAGGSQKRL